MTRFPDTEATRTLLRLRGTTGTRKAVGTGSASRENYERWSRAWDSRSGRTLSTRFRRSSRR